MSITEIVQITKTCTEGKTKNGDPSYFVKGKFVNSMIKNPVSLFASEHLKGHLQKLKIGDIVLITGEINIKTHITENQESDYALYVRCNFVKTISTNLNKSRAPKKKDV